MAVKSIVLVFKITHAHACVAQINVNTLKYSPHNDQSMEDVRVLGVGVWQLAGKQQLGQKEDF